MRFIMIILYSIYTKVLYSSNIYTFTHTPREKKPRKVLQNSNETKSETNPQKNICATFAEINLHS